MNESVRDLLRQGADTVERPQLDVGHLVAQAERRMFRRRVAAVAMGTVAAAVIVAGGVVALRPDDSHPSPAPPAPTQTPDPGDALVNGRIQGVEEYLGGVRPACGGCYVHKNAFEPDTGMLLVTLDKDVPGSVDVDVDDLGIRVVGPDGKLADITVVGPNGTCGDDSVCGSGIAALGPGEDEVTLQTRAYGAQVQVLGFDGAVRRTMNLSAAVDGEDVRGLAWSPDGSRLAVKTIKVLGPDAATWAHHIWLVDRDGDDPRLVHSLSGPASDGSGPEVSISRVEWSPDGSRLGFIESHTGNGGSGELNSTRAVSLLLPAPAQKGPGEARTLYEDTEQCCAGGPLFLWSPDGTRVALRVPGHVLELSAEDGSVMAEHPFTEADLIWPARQR